MNITWSRTRLFSLTYTVAVYALSVLAIVGVVVPLLIGMPNFSILGIYLAVPMLLAPFVARSFRTGTDGRNGVELLRQLDWRIPSVLIHVLVGVLLYLTAAFAVRPTAFYVVFAGVYGLLFLLVFSSRTDAASSVISLYHCILALLVSIFSVTLNYDYFIGRTDLPAHVGMMISVYETGTMPEAWELYDPFPLWHTYTASAYALLGESIDPHTTMVLLSGLIFGAGVIMMYVLTRGVYPNETVALLSSLVLIAIPDYLFYGMYSISRSITSVLFIVLLFTLVSRSSTRMRLLSIVFIADIVFYHTVSIPFVLILLGVLYVAERGYGVHRNVVERAFGARTYVVEGPVVLIAGAVTSIYWLYRAESLASVIVNRTVGIFVGTGATDTAPGGVLQFPWREVANYVPYTFLLFFVLVGFLFWFERTRETSALLTSFSVATVLMIPLLVPGPTLLIDSLAGVNVARFAHYGFMFLALTGGYGLYMLVRKGGVKTVIILLLLVSCFSLVSVSNDFVASDNPLVEREFYTYYLTEQERHSFEQLDAVHRDALGSDHITCRYYEEILQSECERLIVEDESVTHEIADGVLVRTGELEQRPLQLADSTYVYDDELPWGELSDRNLVHDSNEVVYYR
ncbi:hypothetical protein [Halomontanus rarus]|uniref:hypothetical protein n=1 Tax=Halomontanus rarus TaxID=3034020 RepID=UPI001A97E271